MRGDGGVHHALPAAVGAQLGAHLVALLLELNFPIAVGVGEVGSLGAECNALAEAVKALHMVEEHGQPLVSFLYPAPDVADVDEDFALLDCSGAPAPPGRTGTCTWALRAAVQGHQQVQRTLLLHVVVGEGAAILQLLADEDEALLVGGNALLVLDLVLDKVDGFGGLNLESDCFSCERFDEYLYCHCYVVTGEVSEFLVHVWFMQHAAAFCSRLPSARVLLTPPSLPPAPPLPPTLHSHNIRKQAPKEMACAPQPAVTGDTVTPRSYRQSVSIG